MTNMFIMWCSVTCMTAWHQVLRNRVISSKYAGWKWWRLTLKVLYFWKFTSYCNLKPLWSGMGEVVPARTSPTLHPPSPPTVHQLSQLALYELNFFSGYMISTWSTQEQEHIPLPHQHTLFQHILYITSDPNLPHAQSISIDTVH